MPKKLSNEEYLQRIKDKGILNIPQESYIGANVKIRHRCPFGHEWLIQPANVLRGVGCAYCNGNAQKTHEQYEEELLKMESSLYPIERYKTARDKIKHSCVEGHISDVTPNTVLNMKIGCTFCSKTGFDSSKPAHLYYIRITEGSKTYYKIGITNKTVIERFRNEFKNKQMVILLDKLYDIGIEAKQEEARILKTFENERVSVHGLFKHMGGNTELFDSDVLQLDTNDKSCDSL